MFVIEKTFRFEAAHHLSGLAGDHKCANAHGHSYAVVIELGSPALDDNGFVTDFADLDPLGDYIKTVLDHRYLNQLRITGADGADAGPLLPQPTCEHLARHLYETAARVLPSNLASLVTAVRVSETATTSATCLPGNTS